MIPRRNPPDLRPLVVLGTRPEAVKLAPLILEMKRRRGMKPVVCSTGQHREMLDQVLGYFEVQPDIDLGLMTPGQTLSQLTSRCFAKLDEVIQQQSPDCVVVQGDTTTVMVAAVVAFYHQLPVVHVEAGLRTGDLKAPWPEEFNRRVAGIVTRFHCAPTERSREALLNEGTPEDRVRVTGNTVIDALLHTVERERDGDQSWREIYPMAGKGPMVLITGHRRENFGEGLAAVCRAIGELAGAHPDVAFVYPVHLNPNVKQPVHDALGDRPNIHLVAPADYPGFVWLMDQAQVVITDSGGVQEEAPSLGCSVLVTRDKTERPEAVESGLAELVGTDGPLIVRRVSEMLSAPSDRGEVINPYGDGKASKRITDWMLE